MRRYQYFHMHDTRFVPVPQNIERPFSFWKNARHGGTDVVFGLPHAFTQVMLEIQSTICGCHSTLRIPVHEIIGTAFFIACQSTVSSSGSGCLPGPRPNVIQGHESPSESGWVIFTKDGLITLCWFKQNLFSHQQSLGPGERPRRCVDCESKFLGVLLSVE